MPAIYRTQNCSPEEIRTPTTGSNDRHLRPVFSSCWRCPVHSAIQPALVYAQQPAVDGGVRPAHLPGYTADASVPLLFEGSRQYEQLWGSSCSWGWLQSSIPVLLLERPGGIRLRRESFLVYFVPCRYGNVYMILMFRSVAPRVIAYGTNSSIQVIALKIYRILLSASMLYSDGHRFDVSGTVTTSSERSLYLSFDMMIAGLAFLLCRS